MNERYMLGIRLEEGLTKSTELFKLISNVCGVKVSRSFKQLICF